MTCIQDANRHEKDNAVKCLCRISRRREIRIGRLVIWMNVAFLVCWMPYGVVSLLYFFGGEGWVT